MNNKAVKKTLTIPYWLNKVAEEEKINFSDTLQKALKDKLGLQQQEEIYMKEIWKDVFGYEGLYEVSNLGRIKSVEKYVTRGDKQIVFYESKIKKITITNNGNAVVGLTKDNIAKSFTVARVVYKAFNPEFDINNFSLAISNRDKNKENNNIDNLYIKKRKEMLGSVEKPIICVTTNEIFKSTQEASKFYNTGGGNITNCCRGKLKSCGKLLDGTKLVWEYIEE